jgi:hypothetical protein
MRGRSACSMSAIDTQPLEGTMRKLIITGIAGLTLVLTGVVGVTLASAKATSPTKLTVAMRDPGCHWFFMGGGANHKYATTFTHSGPVALANLDEAALKIKGPTGTKIERVGANLTLRAKGVYRITMVGQASDDNHLKLTIK